MKMNLLVIQVFIALFLFKVTQPLSQEAKNIQCDLLIKNVSLFDGRENKGIADIAVKDGNIIRIAKNSKKFTASVTIDGTGKYMVPGLINSHVHLWSYNESATDDQLKLLKAKKVFIIPTALIQQRAWSIIERSPADEHTFKGSLSTMPIVLQEIRRLHAAGITILAGTDPPNYGINHHDDLLEELSIYSRAGLSGEEALRTATGNPSAIFHLDGIGIIAEKHKANFILLNTNPLANITALKDIYAIWKNGVKVR